MEEGLGLSVVKSGKGIQPSVVEWTKKLSFLGISQLNYFKQ